MEIINTWCLFVNSVLKKMLLISYLKKLIILLHMLFKFKMEVMSQLSAVSLAFLVFMVIQAIENIFGNGMPSASYAAFMGQEIRSR